MKKLSWKFLLMTGLMVSIFFACGDDEDDGPDLLPPTISSPDDASVAVGATTTLSYSVTTGGGFASASVASSNEAVATAEVTTPPADDSPSGTLTVTVTGVAAGETTITLTVTDNENQSATDDADITVTEDTTTPPPTDGPATAGSALDTIAELSTLNAAVDAIDGLTATLDGAEKVTIFAPNNAAFTALLAANSLEDGDLDGLIEALTANGVSAVLQAHVVGDSLGADEVIAAATGDSLTTLQGAKIGVTVEGENVFVNGAQVVNPNIIVGNGVIHVIDSVINTEVAGEEGGESESDIDASQAPRESLQAYLESEFTGNIILDPALGGVASSAGGLNPVPSAAEVSTNVAPYPADAFFTSVSYKGAFDPTAGTTWLDGWSLLSTSGILSTGTAQNNGAAYDPATATIVEVQSPITEDVTWTSDNVYQISGYTFVDGATLTIEPGTVIIADEISGVEDDAASLIITTSATIEANGTAEEPIIFTSVLDDGSLAPTDAGLWGGIVILGTAPAEANGATSGIQIEGIPAEEGNSTYGGTDAEDNSGTLRYVSIRHTGDILGSGDEVQGLTLGGVGSGTTIEYVESIASNDDRVEIFGGTVDIKYFAVAYQKDDAFDIDQGWSGNGQFLFSLAIPSDVEAGEFFSDHAGEWDGFDEGDAASSLTSDFTIYNATFVGAGQQSSRSTDNPAILVRENAEVVLANSIITNYNGKAIDIQDEEGTDEGDSFAKFQNGEIDLLGNIYNVNPSYTDFSSGDTGIVVGN